MPRTVSSSEILYIFSIDIRVFCAAVCDITTPLGSPVEPEVNITYAIGFWNSGCFSNRYSKF